MEMMLPLMGQVGRLAEEEEEGEVKIHSSWAVPLWDEEVEEGVVLRHSQVRRPLRSHWQEVQELLSQGVEGQND